MLEKSKGDRNPSERQPCPKVAEKNQYSITKFLFIGLEFEDIFGYYIIYFNYFFIAIQVTHFITDAIWLQAVID